MTAAPPGAHDRQHLGPTPDRTRHPKRGGAREFVVHSFDKSEPPQSAATTNEVLLTGAQLLRREFARSPVRYGGREIGALAAADNDTIAMQLVGGFGFSSCVLPNGHRAILDILVPGDIAGLDRLVLNCPGEEFSLIGRTGYRTLAAANLRSLMAEPSVATYIMAAIVETRWRALRLAAAIGRLDAQGRLCVLLLDLHDRLRRRDLISRPSYNLPLTQEQLADHLGLTLVHVNRTLRRLREERIAMVDRQVVVIQDMERLRHYAQGLPEPPEMPDPALPA